MEMDNKIVDDYIKFSDFIKFSKIIGAVNKSKRTIYRYYEQNKFQLQTKKIGKYIYIFKKDLLKILGPTNFRKFEIYLVKKKKIKNKKVQLKNKKIEIVIPSFLNNITLRLNSKTYQNIPFLKKKIKLPPQDYIFFRNEAYKNKIPINKLINQYIMIELLNDYLFK